MISTYKYYKSGLSKSFSRDQFYCNKIFRDPSRFYDKQHGMKQIRRFDIYTIMIGVISFYRLSDTPKAIPCLHGKVTLYCNNMFAVKCHFNMTWYRIFLHALRLYPFDANLLLPSHASTSSAVGLLLYLPEFSSSCSLMRLILLCQYRGTTADTTNSFDVVYDYRPYYVRRRNPLKSFRKAAK